MKRFTHTLIGKSILYAACCLLLALTLLLGGCLLTVVRDRIDQASEKELFNRVINRKLRGGEIIWQAGLPQDDTKRLVLQDNSNLLRMLYDGNDWVAKSADFDQGGWSSVWPVSRWRYGYSDYKYSELGRSEGTEAFNLELRFRDGFPYEDEYRAIYLQLHTAYALRQLVWVLLPLTVLLLGLCFYLLIRASARRNGQEGIFPGLLHKLPWELLLLLAAAGTALLGAALYYGTQSIFFKIYAPGLPIAIGLCLFLPGLVMGAAARIKDKTLWKKSLAGRFYSLLPMYGKTILAGLLVSGCVLGLMLLARGSEAGRVSPGIDIPLWILFAILLTGFFLFYARGLKRLQIAGEQLANGEAEERIDTRGLSREQQRHGENLNRLGEGMEKAIRERLKSEQAKTELISNVSHDLRTPLTSLISYADLLAKEESDNPKVGEYAAVISRQSNRLGRLIGDITEAVQAGSGTLSVEAEPCDAATLLSQAAGEYEDRFREAGLTPVLRLPQENLVIMADSRRMWRIFDNLLGNISKYALPGSRVYLELAKEEGGAVFSFKNVSRDAISAEPGNLKERFVRGDAARHSEGSGLGLAIADSLTTLQGGNLSIQVDGDLFKAELRFPLI